MQPRGMESPERHAHLAALGAATAGAVHLNGCRAAGLTDEQIGWLVESGRWQSPFPRVYVTFSGPIPTATMHHAAILYAGDGAVLSHETAGAFCRLCREPGAIHLTVPYDRDVADQPGLVIHRSRTLAEDDVHPVFTPRRTTAERTVLDLLAGCATADAALGSSRMPAVAPSPRPTNSARHFERGRRPGGGRLFWKPSLTSRAALIPRSRSVTRECVGRTTCRWESGSSSGTRTGRNISTYASGSIG